ncbi:MAG: hypothetical protein NTW35_00340 [Candidatus Nomurabacteria bacterium]|nr:hypothetical protein [Candidatus Nomurabacteria bacterium]
MLHNRLFFKVFLIIYGGFLLVHVWGIGFDSWLLLAGLLGGMAVALVAHKGHGYLPSVFLVGHMLIEWYHHALDGNHYDGSEIAFHGIHALLDMVFLYVEAKEHFGKYALPFLGVVVTIIVSIFAFNYVPAPSTFTISHLVNQALEMQKDIGEHHSHGGGILHYVVIGGMLGCVLSHLFLAPRWKHIHQY